MFFTVPDSHSSSFLKAVSALIALLVVALGGVTGAPAATFPDGTIPDSFSVQLKGGNTTTENLDMIKELGVKYIRHGFPWEGIEKAPGIYDFSSSDEWVKECEDRGLSIIGCIAFGNALYGPVAEDKGRDAYVKYAAALAEHYKGAPIIWEIWNEPNTRTFWSHLGTATDKSVKGNSEKFADEYVALVKAVAPAMHAADPNCTILGGSVSGVWTDSYAWSDWCFQKGILTSGIDGWSVHPYSTKNPEDYMGAYAIIRGLMTKNGGSDSFPIINTERGYPVGKAEGFAGGDPALSKEYQAWHCVRQYLMDLVCGIKLTSWYEWSGTEGFSLVQGNEKTPAYNAAKFMIDYLKGYHLDGRISLDSPRDFVLRFVNASGGVKLVAWTAPPAGPTPEKGSTPDKTVTHAVTIPVQAAGPLDNFQIYGNKSAVTVANGSITLTLTGAPQYVTVAASK